MKEKWDLDHRFPIKAFINFGITNLKTINHLDNLQPLPTSVNRKKSSKYNKKKFEKWLQSITLLSK